MMDCVLKHTAVEYEELRAAIGLLYTHSICLSDPRARRLLDDAALCLRLTYLLGSDPARWREFFRIDQLPECARDVVVSKAYPIASEHLTPE